MNESLENCSAGLESDDSHKSFVISMHFCDSAHIPSVPWCVVCGEDDVSYFNISLRLDPLLPFL